MNPEIAYELKRIEEEGHEANRSKILYKGHVTLQYLEHIMLLVMLFKIIIMMNTADNEQKQFAEKFR